MQKRHWSYLAALMGWCIPVVVDCGGRERAFERDGHSTSSETTAVAGGQTGVGGTGAIASDGTTRGYGGTPATFSAKTTSNGGLPSTLTAGSTIANGGTTFAATVTATNVQGGTSVVVQSTTSWGGASGVTGSGGTSSWAAGGSSDSTGLGGVSGMRCVGVSGWISSYGGFAGANGGQAGSENDSCHEDPDCCAYCAQQARTAFYLDGDCQPVSCADPYCLSVCWMYHLRGGGSAARARVKCCAQGIWTCEPLGLGSYRARAPEGC